MIILRQYLLIHHENFKNTSIYLAFLNVLKPSFLQACYHHVLAAKQQHRVAQQHANKQQSSANSLSLSSLSRSLYTYLKNKCALLYRIRLPSTTANPLALFVRVELVCFVASFGKKCASLQIQLNAAQTTT